MLIELRLSVLWNLDLEFWIWFHFSLFFNLGIQLIQRKKPFFWSSIKSVDFRRFWQAGDRLLLLFSTVWFVVLGMIPWVFIDVTFQSCCRPIWEEKITSEADYILAAGVKIEFLRLRRRSFKKHNSYDAWAGEREISLIPTQKSNLFLFTLFILIFFPHFFHLIHSP